MAPFAHLPDEVCPWWELLNCLVFGVSVRICWHRAWPGQSVCLQILLWNHCMYGWAMGACSFEVRCACRGSGVSVWPLARTSVFLDG